MSVGRICSRSTHLADPEESAQVAADRMRAESVGTLIVIDANRVPVGIITDRDLVVRVMARGMDARRAKVGQVMSAHPRCVSEETPIEDAVATMRRLVVRRLPVVDEDGRLVGVVSIDDVLELVAEELGNLGRIAGSSYPGVAIPASPSRPKEPTADAGLRRASSDLEC